jgi:pyruvate kinase
MAKKTKIVATLGLVSDKKEILKSLIENGMNVARLNFSHGSHEWHGNVIRIIRELSAEMNVAVGILADLQGPRIRTLVEAPVEMLVGETILISDIESIKAKSQKLEAKSLLLDVPNIVDDIEVGNEILIEDGLMKVVVFEKKDGVLTTKVIDGGIVNNHKGVNIPDAKLQISPITEKDEKDLAFVLGQDVDFVAMSFVSTGANIEDLRGKMKNILEREDNLPQIVAKIERKEAIKNLDEIIEHTDAVMVARGDLGIEIEGTRVAILQKEIIRKSILKMKPVIVATQMLNSMIENPRPTRAEVSDVTNAVVDHADAVMLSGESASGKYPLESVRTMAEIAVNTEASPFDDMSSLMNTEQENERVDIARSAYELAKSCNAKAIVLGSASGLTARFISHFRPEQQMYAVTDNKLTYDQLSLVWGIESFLYEKGGVFREDIDWLVDSLKTKGKLAVGDKVVVIMGQVSGEENMRLIGIKEI